MKNALFVLDTDAVGPQLYGGSNQAPLRVTKIDGVALAIAPDQRSQPFREGNEFRPTVHLRTEDSYNKILLDHNHAKIEVSGTLAIEKPAEDACRSGMARRPISGRIHYRSENDGDTKGACATFKRGKTVLLAGDGANLMFAVVEGL